MTIQYKQGSVIEYRAFGGVIRQVTVTATYPDIKNGRPGFDGVSASSEDEVWGYDDQIIRVVTL